VKLPVQQDDDSESEIDEQPTFDQEDIEDSEIENDSLDNQRFMPNGRGNHNHTSINNLINQNQSEQSNNIPSNRSCLTPSSALKLERNIDSIVKNKPESMQIEER
jgi:hypothetical protein